MGTPIPFIHLLWLSWVSRPRHYIRQSKIFHRILDQEPSLRDIAVGRDSESTCWKYQPNKNQPIYRYHVPTPIPPLPNHTNQTPKKPRLFTANYPLTNPTHRTHGLHSCLERMKERLMKKKKTREVVIAISRPHAVLCSPLLLPLHTPYDGSRPPGRSSESICIQFNLLPYIYKLDSPEHQQWIGWSGPGLTLLRLCPSNHQDLFHGRSLCKTSKSFSGC